MQLGISKPKTDLLVCLCWGFTAQSTQWGRVEPLAIPNQFSLISMHITSLVKIPWFLLKFSSGNENMRVSRAENSSKTWPNLPISNPKPDFHNNKAHTNFGENPLMFTNLSSRNEIRTEGQTHGRPMWYHDTPPLLCGGVYWMQNMQKSVG